MKYDELNIYEASYDEVYEAVREQYKNREWKMQYPPYKRISIRAWERQNMEIKRHLREMGVKFQNAFYNPNNMRIYIKQKIWIEKTNVFEGLPFSMQQEETMIYGSRAEAKKAWNEERMNSSMQYSIATNTDYYTEDDYFTVPSW